MVDVLSSGSWPELTIQLENHLTDKSLMVIEVSPVLSIFSTVNKFCGFLFSTTDKFDHSESHSTSHASLLSPFLDERDVSSDVSSESLILPSFPAQAADSTASETLWMLSERHRGFDFERKKGGEGRSWWEEVGEISVGSRLSTGADLFQSLCAVGNIYVTHTQKVLHSFGLDAVNKNIIITCILYVHVV